MSFLRGCDDSGCVDKGGLIVGGLIEGGLSGWLEAHRSGGYDRCYSSIRRTLARPLPIAVAFHSTTSPD